jgi:hypothetical protein
MVFLNFTKTINRWIGPFWLRRSTQIASKFGLNSAFFDAFLGVSLAQKLISIEVHDEFSQPILKAFTHDEAPSLTASDATKESIQRVAILEKYVRPALVPHNRWTDTQAWRFNARLVRWLRCTCLL